MKPTKALLFCIIIALSSCETENLTVDNPENSILKINKDNPKITGKAQTKPIVLDEVIIIKDHESSSGSSTSAPDINSGWEVINPSGSTSSNNSGGGGGSSSGSISSIGSDTELQAKINQTNPTAFDMQLTQQQNQVLATTSFNLLPWTGIKIFVTQNIGKPYTIQTVTSDSWGLTTGFTWSQNALSQSTSGNITTLNIVGTMTINTGVQGIGNVYSKTITFQIKINNTNGQIQSGSRLP